MTLKRQVANWLTTIHVVGSATAFFGWLVSHGHGRPPTWLELVFSLVNLPVNFSFVSGVTMLLLAGSLMRRKRVAWVASIAVQLVGIGLSVASLFRLPIWAPLRTWWPSLATTAVDVASIPVGLGILFLLGWLRPEFQGQLRRGSAWQSVAVLAGGLFVAVAVTWVVLLARGAATLHQLESVLARSAGFTSPQHDRALRELPAWLPAIPGVLTGVVVLGAVLVFLRTADDPRAWSLERERALRGIIARWGGADSLAYFGTRRDKSTVFSPGGGAAVAYRVIDGVCLAAGDPIGDPRHWPDAIRIWLAEARSYGWIPAVTSASETGARAWVAAGMTVLRLGDEAVLEERGFAAAKAADAQLRRAIRHVATAGVQIGIVRQRQCTAEQLREFSEAAARWRQKGAERGFSMALGREGDPADGDILHVEARTRDGVLVGLLSFVPWGSGGLSLDVMRRSPDAPHGITEAMVDALMAAAGRLGVKQVSLNFCVFRGAFAEAERFGATGMERLGGTVLGFFDRFWQLERLYRANRQYGPRWVPRYLCYPDALALPRVALALGTAEGFLPDLRLTGHAGPQTLTPDQAAEVAQLERVEIDPALFAPPVTSTDAVRLAHLDKLEQEGHEGYPAVGARPTRTVAQLATEGWREGELVRVAGRIRHIRDHGGVAFLDLTDGDAAVQLRVERPHLAALDQGDLVLVEGVTRRSHSEAPVVDVHVCTVQAKALHRVRFDGWLDQEGRAHNRSEDLLTDPAGMRLLRTRARVTATVRRVLTEAGFWEAETPVLHSVHGGASARPFHTHLNAYHQDLSLRIAPELYLKRLLVAGSGPIFEVSRNFRNEGVDATHNPEFTSVEAYRPFADYDDMRFLAQDLVRAAAIEVRGEAALTLGAERLSLEGDWPVVSVLDAVSAALGADVAVTDQPSRVALLAQAAGAAVDPDWPTGRMIEEIYGDLVEAATVRPTFYVDFPVETSPLTRPHRLKPGLVERWDLVVAGLELGTAYTELTDPRIQRERLVRQSLAAAAGDSEAMEVDEEFLRALELGMPPTGGLGLGLDRLVMLLTGEPIRSVLSFPFTRGAQ